MKQTDFGDELPKAGAARNEDGRFEYTGMMASCKDAGADEHRYDDIIDLPHHVSKVHPQMPLYDRAAQFAPFAALSGHGDAIKEKERQVEERIRHEYD